MADSTTFPVSYNDPAYAAADQSASASVGIPAGWLSNIRTQGEKSNADQVSSAGARTPYQITPDTRNAIIKQTGVDPYLSPSTAAYGAAYLLKQSLDRNGGNPILATAEYHGGTDPSNWGAKTMAYVKRVTGSSPNNPNATPSFMQGAQGSPSSNSYQLAAPPQIGSDQDGPSPMQQIYAAYKGGKMTPDDAQAFEQDVQAGHIVLPAGSTLNPRDTGNQAPGTIIEMGPNGQEIGETAPAGGAPVQAQAVPQQVVDAYNNAQMSPADAAQFKADVASGAISLPAGANLKQQQSSLGQTAGVAARGYLQGLANSAGGLIDKARGIVDMPAQALSSVMQGGGPLNAVDQLAGTHLAAVAPTPSQPSAAAGLPAAAPNLPSIPESATVLMNKAGLPSAQTPGQQVVLEAAQGAGALTVPLPGMALRAVPAMVAAGATGGAVGEAVHQATGSPMLGMAANLLTTVLSPAAASRVMSALAAEAPAVAAARAEPGMQAAQSAAAPEATAEQSQMAGAATRMQEGQAHAAAAGIAPPPQGGIVGARETAGGTAPPAEPTMQASTPEMPAAEGVAPDPVVAPSSPPGAVAAESGAPAAASAQSIPQTAPPPEAPAVSTEIVPTSAQEFMPASELAAQTRKAVGAEGAPFGLGKNMARDTLATQAAPDPEIVGAANRLGMTDMLDPDHLTSNQSYRELAQAIKSNPGSLAGQAQMENLQSIGLRAQQMIEKAGGTTDLSDLSSEVKNQHQAIIDGLGDTAEGLYGEVNKAIPAGTPAPAPNTLAFINQRLEDLGGNVKNLTEGEQRLLNRLTPQEVPMKINGQTVDPKSLGMDAQMQQPTYALLDNERQHIGMALDGQLSPFSKAPVPLLKKLYGELAQDQEQAADDMGVGNTYRTATATVAMRKSYEDDMTKLYGRQLGDSIVGKLGTAMSSLSEGDESKFVNLVKSVPENLRKRVTASGLQYAFGNATKNGVLNFKSFADWMDGVKKNSGAFNALMANLPADSRRQFLDLATVSRGIAKSLRENISTGRIMAARQDLGAAPDGVMSKVLDKAKEAAIGVGVAGAAHAAGPIGAGLGHAIVSALSHGKPDVMKAADELLVSPEFMQLAKAGGAPTPEQIKAVANSGAMRRFYGLAKDAGAPGDPATRERWLRGILSSIQSEDNSNVNR